MEVSSYFLKSASLLCFALLCVFIYLLLNFKHQGSADMSFSNYWCTSGQSHIMPPGGFSQLLKVSIKTIFMLLYKYDKSIYIAWFNRATYVKLNCRNLYRVTPLLMPTAIASNASCRGLMDACFQMQDSRKDVNICHEGSWSVQMQGFCFTLHNVCFYLL